MIENLKGTRFTYECKYPGWPGRPKSQADSMGLGPGFPYVDLIRPTFVTRPVITPIWKCAYATRRLHMLPCAPCHRLVD